MVRLGRRDRKVEQAALKANAIAIPKAPPISGLSPPRKNAYGRPMSNSSVELARVDALNHAHDAAERARDQRGDEARPVEASQTAPTTAITPATAAMPLK